MLSSHSVVSSSRTVRPCSPRGGRWIWHWRTTWSTVCSSALHSGSRGGNTPFVQAGGVTSDTGAEAVKPDPGSSWEGHSGGGGCRCQGWKCGVLWGCPPTPHSVGDPPRSPHVYCYCCQMNWWDVVRRVQMGVSIWGAVRLHSMDGWALSRADVQAPWLGVLETVWLHCDEAQQVECLQHLMIRGHVIVTQDPWEEKMCWC